MGTTKLKIFKEALRELGQSTISDTNDGDVNPRSLAEAWADTVNYCLEQGYWNFAVRTSALATGGAILFGYTHSADKPSDWVRTVRVSATGTFWPPLENYEDALGAIQTLDKDIYLAYVSNHATAGLHLGHWPQSFCAFVACELAARVCARCGGSQQDYDRIAARAKAYLTNALLKDSIDGGTLARVEDFAIVSGPAEPDRS